MQQSLSNETVKNKIFIGVSFWEPANININNEAGKSAKIEDKVKVVQGVEKEPTSRDWSSSGVKSEMLIPLERG